MEIGLIASYGTVVLGLTKPSDRHKVGVRLHASYTFEAELIGMSRINAGLSALRIEAVLQVFQSKKKMTPRDVHEIVQAGSLATTRNAMLVLVRQGRLRYEGEMGKRKYFRA